MRCHSRGGGRSVDRGTCGAGIEPRKQERNGVPTESINPGGNIWRIVSVRVARTPRGQRPRSRTGAPCTGPGRALVWLREGPEAASESSRTQADEERAREVRQPRSTGEALEQSRETGGGGGGGKGAGQRELAGRQRVPDAGPGKRVICSRAGTSGRREGPAAAVHGALSPCLRGRASARGLPRTQARRLGGSRRRDVAALRGGTGGQPSGSLGTAEEWSVSGEAGSEGIHHQGGWAAEAAGCAGAGRQAGPAGDRRCVERDLRMRLRGLLVRVPAGAQRASGAGCSGGGDPDEGGELGTRRRHPVVLRYPRPRMVGEVSRAPCGGPARGAVGQEVACRGRAGRRRVEAE